MFLGNEEHIQIGKKHLSKIKEMFDYRKNVAQETFDTQPLHMRKTICFHAGLKNRHVDMKFAELTPTERHQVVAALNSLLGLTEQLPKFISEDDCRINIKH
ncbi:MAG: hypothetical protein P4L95_22670 [Rouxiella aceris]|uniref:hypothetical protein n=1 Tax=Rouxiella aceris TaxID=2703884 RepID=UPI00284EFB71|nr:hypothetical protein [Rouxiella aceris]MDR3434668.1 hypothetical protein [Rouxiella aceris]